MVDNGFNTEWEQEINLYLDNELSEAGRERVEKHLQRSEASARYFRIVQREDQLLSGRLRHEFHQKQKVDEFTDAVMDALPANPSNPLVQKSKHHWQQLIKYFTAHGRRRLALAVSIIICVVGILASMQIRTPDEYRFINLKHNGVYIRSMLPALFFAKDSQGEFYEFPDTSVILASQGTLFTVENYQEGSGETSVGTERRLSLKTGELFIDVHPEHEGFTVLCSNAKATVFGTQFYISTQPGSNKKTMICVREGKVMVEKQGRNQTGSTIVSPGEMVSVVTENEHVILRPPQPMTIEFKERLEEFNRIQDNPLLEGIMPHHSPMEKNSMQPLVPDMLDQSKQWDSVTYQ